MTVDDFEQQVQKMIPGLADDNAVFPFTALRRLLGRVGDRALDVVYDLCTKLVSKRLSFKLLKNRIDSSFTFWKFVRLSFIINVGYFVQDLFDTFWGHESSTSTSRCVFFTSPVFSAMAELPGSLLLW